MNDAELYKHERGRYSALVDMHMVSTAELSREITHLKHEVKRLQTEGAKAQLLLSKTEDSLGKMDYNPAVDELLDEITTHRTGDESE